MPGPRGGWACIPAAAFAGRVQFRIESELEPIQVCHCSQCRKAHGTPFATNMPVRSSAFHPISGSELLAQFESSPGKKRVFCRRCGSPVYSYKASLPTWFACAPVSSMSRCLSDRLRTFIRRQMQLVAHR